MFVSFITSWDGADEDLRLVISPHVGPEVLFGGEGPPTFFTSELFLVSV